MYNDNCCVASLYPFSIWLFFFGSYKGISSLSFWNAKDDVFKGGPNLLISRSLVLLEALEPGDLT